MTTTPEQNQKIRQGLHKYFSELAVFILNGSIICESMDVQYELESMDDHGVVLQEPTGRVRVQMQLLGLPITDEPTTIH